MFLEVMFFWCFLVLPSASSFSFYLFIYFCNAHSRLLHFLHGHAAGDPAADDDGVDMLMPWWCALACEDSLAAGPVQKQI